MGTYKVFNGTDWVNICDCQVRIRNASNNWQLLDPANCVTKYWTGTEWCEVTCTPVDPCACTTGEVVIGTQTWTCRNLDVTEYRNGDPIPEVTNPAVWQTLTTGAWRYYDNDPINGAIYGKMYNWYAVNDNRGLAPNGYKIPTQSDWNILQGYLNTLPGGNNAGGKMKQAGTMLWNAPNTDATNSSCFTGLPGGWVNFVGSFYEIGNTGHWWSSTPDGVNLASARILSYNSGIFSSQSEYIGNGLSIRLLKEDLPPAGCTEPEVIIGTQRWTRTNLNVTQYRNGDPIPQVTDPVAWSNLTTGAWCHYNNDPANDAIYGKMYNGYAVNDSRGLAPNGFHVPTEAEWITLSNYLGGASNSAGGKLKEAGTTHWNSPNTGATNESCFTGLPGGYRFGSGAFSDIGNRGMFWTSTAGSLASSNWTYYLYYDVPYVLNANYQRNVGLSVRLIRD